MLDVAEKVVVKGPSNHSIRSLEGKVSAEEWKQRVELAALYRLVALYGWDDLIFTHISARIPGPEHHFLINPYGMMFEEITASSLVKIDTDGNKAEDSPYPAWSADGKRIAFLGIAGMYVMNADGSDLKKVSEQVGHGEISWYAP